MQALEERLIDGLDADSFDIDLNLALGININVYKEEGEIPYYCVRFETRTTKSLGLSEDLTFVQSQSEDDSIEDYQEAVDGYIRTLEKIFNRESGFRDVHLRSIVKAVNQNTEEMARIRKGIRNPKILKLNLTPVMSIDGDIIISEDGSVRGFYQRIMYFCVQRNLAWLILKETSEQLSQDLLVLTSYIESKNNPRLAYQVSELSSYYKKLGTHASIAIPVTERFFDFVVNFYKSLNIEDEPPNIGMLKDRIMKKMDSYITQVPGHLFGVQVPNYPIPQQ